MVPPFDRFDGSGRLQTKQRGPVVREPCDAAERDRKKYS
jgi:hypothetical protein